MAKPTNLDEYYEKMLAIRNQLKEYKNTLKAEGVDLVDVTKGDLTGWGLGDTHADYEANRLAKAKSVHQALTDFSNASV